MKSINFASSFSAWLLASSVAFSGGLEPDDSVGSLTNTIMSPAIDAASSKLENSALKFLPEGSTAEIVFNTIDEGSGSEPYGYAVFVIPISQTKNTLLFNQSQINRYTVLNSSRVAANLGVGFRQLSDDESYFIGTNLFFDLDDEANKRASLGLEFHSSIVGANANLYRSLGSSSNLVDGNTERVLDGYDINIVGQMPFMPWAEIVYTDYRWEAEIASQDSDGYKFAGEFWLTDYLRLEIGVDDSKATNRNEFAGLSFSYPSRERPSLNDGFFTSKAFPEVSVRADLNMKVRRNNRLVIETEGSGVVITRLD